MTSKMIAAVLAATALSACSATVYTNEAGTLATATAAITSSVPSVDSITDVSRQVVHDSDAERFMAIGGNVQYDTSCENNAYVAVQAFLDTVRLNASQSDQDTAFAKFADLKPCGIVGASNPSDAPSAKKPDKPKTPAETKKDADAKAAKDRANQNLDDAELRAAAQNHAPTTPPNCAPNCALEDYTKPIGDYAANVQSIVSGKNVSDVQDALKKGDAAVDSLLTAVKASPLAGPAIDAANALANLALQDAQYAALKSLVFNFDQSWPLMEPAVAKAARIRYALLIYARAATSMEAALTAQEFVNDPANYKDIAERLQLYDYFNAKVTTAASAMSDAVKIDPKKTFDAVGDANHALALALLDPSRQMPALGDALKSLSDQATAIKKAAAPPAAKK